VRLTGWQFPAGRWLEFPGLGPSFAADNSWIEVGLFRLAKKTLGNSRKKTEIVFLSAAAR